MAEASRALVRVDLAERECDEGLALDELLAWMGDSVKDLTAEARATVQVDLRGDGDFGREFVLTVERPETDEEMARRVARHDDYVRYAEARDIAILNQLREKYPDA
jgi:hypothetical protein